jgi:adenylosuccinate synthase
VSLAIALTGPIAVGKTALAQALNHLGWRHASTSAYLRVLAGPTANRDRLAATANQLDRDNPGWMAGLVSGELTVVDSVGSLDQLHRLRQSADYVLVVALRAPAIILRDRRMARDGYASLEAGDFGGRDDLAAEAHLVLDTVADDPWGLARTVHQWATGCRLAGRGSVDAVVGGQYGSEGKGHVVSRIAPLYTALVRSGGPNAGHRVWLGEKGGGGRESYVYHHLPSGTLHNPRAAVFIAAGATLNLRRFIEEVAETGCKERLFVDHRAVIIDDDDIRAESEYMVGAIGSTAQGVGRATARRVMRGAMESVRIAGDIPELRNHVTDVSQAIGALVEGGARVLLEGTQGSGLSLYHGPYPHTTSRDTNVGGLLAECGVAPSYLRRIVAVFRTHPIRVAGNSGPMATETDWEAVATKSGVPADTLRERERTSTTKRLRRVGEFDWDLFDATIRLNRPTDLALTFADYLDPRNAEAREMAGLTAEAGTLIQAMQERARARVSMVATGFGPPRRTILTDGSWS